MGNSGAKAVQPEAKLDKTIDGVRYRIVFESEPFQQGACRLAFKGVYIGNGPLDGKKCVTKVFIDEAQRHYKHYKPDVKASEKANEFAQKFNMRFSSTKPLRFIVPKVATVAKVPGDSNYAKPGDKILVEDYIEGDYEKFSNNESYQSDKVTAIPAFTHFTFSSSNGAYLVCDIQGVREPNGYTLTDPAVLSRTAGQYGPTDLGPAGMAKFFKYHKCTNICNQLSLPQFNGNKMISDGRCNRRESTYTYMLDNYAIEANKYYQNRNDLPAILEE